jgi:antitoxin CptB
MNKELLLKKIKYRSNYRGNKEMDIIFAKFIENHLDQLSLKELNDFQEIISQLDTDLFLWIQNNDLIPSNLNKDIIIKMSKISGFL